MTRTLGVLGALVSWWLTPATVQAEPPLPKAPDGFSVVLFAKDPQIIHPTAMAVGDAGEIYVVEEYWNAKRDGVPETDVIKVLRDTDGDGVADETKVFWDKDLNSVQGLTYLEGTLFAMHAPVLSAFRDTNGDGVADERKDLLVGEKPVSRTRIAGHLISGLAVGIDGWITIQNGDEGWWNVKRPEGGPLYELHGGGLERCRPDGTGLFLFCRGLRNCYGTTAMDAEGDWFTRDNTNDGQGWNVRFSQIVRHADYGYPYLFLNYPDEILPPLSDHGGGSSTGGIVYKETQFPPEFRGAPFFCDWGTRTVYRYVLKEKGASYEPEQHVFLSEGHGDGYEFRPIAIATDAAGSLYVADWSFGGWGKGNGKGRIFKITHGTVAPLPRPPGPGAAPGELIPQLDSDSFAARFRAQRALERLGPRAFEPLAAAKPGPVARIHAAWALARTGGPRSLKILRDWLKDPDPRVVRQAARVLADHDWGSAAIVDLIRLLDDPRPRVRLEAAQDLGTMRAKKAAPALVARLNDPECFVRKAAAFALREIGETGPVLDALMSGDPVTRDGAFTALAERHDLKILLGLGRLLPELESPVDRKRALGILERAGRKPVPWDGEYWSFWPKVKEYPYGTVAWEGTDAAAKAAGAALSDPDPGVRKAASLALRRMGGVAALPLLGGAVAKESDGELLADHVETLKSLRHPDGEGILAKLIGRKELSLPLRLKAMEALASIEGLDDARRVRRDAILRDFLAGIAAAPPETQAEVIDALARVRAAFAADWLAERIRSGPGPVPARAVAALGAVGGPGARAVLAPFLTDGRAEIRRAAVGAVAATLGDKDDSAVLQPALKDGDPGVRTAALVALLKRKDKKAKEAMDPIVGPFLRNWRIIGPFPNPDGKGLETAFPPESGLQGDSHYEGAEGKQVAWRAVNGGEDRIHLSTIYDWQGPGTAYAVAVVESPEPREVLLLAGSDDGILIRVNEEVVLRHAASRPVTPDEEIVHTNLKAGRNVLLLKITNGAGPWGFCLRIADPKSVKDLKYPDPAEAFREDRKNKLAGAAKAGGGDAEKGREIFQGKGLCATCHQVKGQGGHVGPDLTLTAANYARDHFVESILRPSAKIAQGYQPVVVQTEDETTVTGILAEETGDALLLRKADNTTVRIPKADIAARAPAALSLMPEGLADALSEEEFADVLAYLETLK